ncbi:hypothetical protein EV121DRAFT_160881, partial [Schizophyllum commune]
KALIVAVAVASTVLADDYVKFETSDASPPLDQRQTISDSFKQGADPDCAQPYGSGCRTVVGGGGGACNFVLSMQDGTEPQCSDPDSAGRFTQQLIDQCASGGKIGGYYHQDLGGG